MGVRKASNRRSLQCLYNIAFVRLVHEANLALSRFYNDRNVQLLAVETVYVRSHRVLGAAVLIFPNPDVLEIRAPAFVTQAATFDKRMSDPSLGVRGNSFSRHEIHTLYIASNRRPKNGSAASVTLPLQAIDVCLS